MYLQLPFALNTWFSENIHLSSWQNLPFLVSFPFLLHNTFWYYRTCHRLNFNTIDFCFTIVYNFKWRIFQHFHSHAWTKKMQLLLYIHRSKHTDSHSGLNSVHAISKLFPSVKQKCERIWKAICAYWTQCAFEMMWPPPLRIGVYSEFVGQPFFFHAGFQWEKMDRQSDKDGEGEKKRANGKKANNGNEKPIEHRFVLRNRIV